MKTTKFTKDYFYVHHWLKNWRQNKFSPKSWVQKKKLQPFASHKKSKQEINIFISKFLIALRWKFLYLKGLKFTFRLVIEAYLALIGRLDNCIVPVSPHSSYSESRRSLNDSPNLSHPSVIVARPSQTSAVKSRPHGKAWLAWISKKN